MKRAYLTIDDAPAETMPQKLDVLHERGIAAIWFCLGENIEAHEEAVNDAIVRGHVIGNHGYDHTAFSELTRDEALTQIERTDALIESAYERAGVLRPAKVFRFPYLDNGDGAEYGHTDWENPHVHAIQTILRQNGYLQPDFDVSYEWYRAGGFDRCANVDCTFDTYDWCLKDSESEHGYHDLPSVLSRIDEDVPEGGRGLNDDRSDEIIMMHAWIPDEAFIEIIDKIRTKRVAFTLP